MGEEEGKLSYSAEMDDSAFVRGMNNIRESVHETSATVQKTGMTVDNFSKSMNRFYGAADQNFAYYLSRLKDFDNETGKAAEEIKKTTTAAKELGEELEQTGNVAVELSSRLTKAAAGYLSFQKAKEFIQAVATTRGEFQKLEVAFNTMLGSEERAQALLQQLTRTAAITPFDLKGVADGAKQLLAYGVAAEDVNDTLIHLGDIAAGLSIPLNDLVMLYGTTMTQGRMFTQDLRQFMGRGIPLADELAKQFGVTKDKVGELVTAGKVGAEEFNKAIMSMSSEGGKFAGLMEAQSHTIAGQISNIEDAIDTMFNEIGKSNEGIINDVLGSVSYLVENYKKVGAVLMDAVVAIGTYKTALITANAIEKASISIKQAMAVQEALLAAEARNLAAARGISIAAAKAELGSVNVLTVAKIRLTAATKALTASMMANPYTAVAAALAVVAVGVYKLATAEGVETAARRKANEEMQTFADKLDEQQNKIKGYIQTIQDETATEYQKAVAWEMLNKMAPTLTEKYDKAAMATLDLAEATKELNEQADKANYDHIRSEVQKWKEAIERINQNMLDDARYSGGKNAIFNLQQLAGAEAQLDTYLKKLAEIDRIRKKMAEDAKPLEIRIKEANENVQAKQEIYDFYKRAADLAGELKNAHDEAAGVIANSGIPYNYEAIADQTKEKYDALIAELEADVEDLRTRIAESPASLELEQELKGKEKALDDLISMKQQWALSGATTIPLNFVMNFSQVETALQNAKNGQGINTQGMRFNGPTGTWVKDEATAPATMTASQWRKDAYNNWKQAQAAVDAFWNKKEEMDKATFDKEYKSLKDAADQAKKDYDKLKGSTNGKSSAARKAAETARKHQAYLDLIEKQRVEQERAVTDMEFSTEQATIDAMQDGAEKTLRQLKLDHEKRKEEIEREYADLKQAKIDAARRLFESDPANKNKVFGPTKVNTSYSKAESDNYKALLAANQKAYDRALAEQRKAQEQHLLDYIRTYGSIQDQKAAIAKSYEQKIADEQEAIQKKALEAERDRLLSELDFKELKESIDWESVFGDLSRQSTSALRALKEKLRTALDAKDITAENAKTIAEKIKEIEDRITNRTDAWASFLPLLKKRKELVEDTARAEQAFQRALGNQTKALGNQMSLQAKAANIIRTQGDERIDTTDITAEKLKEFVKTLDPASEAYKNLTGIAEQLGIAQTDLTAATEEAAKAEAKRNALDTQLNDFKTFKEAFKEGKEKAGGSIEYGLQQATELNELIDTIGLHDTEFGKGVQEFTDGANHFSSAIQKFNSGDFVGAATDAIKGIQDWGSLVERIGGFSFSGSNADEVAEKVGALNKQNEILTSHIDLLTKAIEENTGIRSVEAAEEARKKQEEITSNKMSSLYEQMGYHDAHRSNNYYASDEVAAGWNERLNKLFYEHRNDFGTDSVGQVDITQWSDMFNMTAEQWAVIKTYANDIWEYMTTVGYYDYSDKFDDVVADAGKAYEYTKKIQETLTGMSFDSFRQSFLDALMDTEDDSERFAESITESYMDSLTKIITQSLINNFVLDSELQEKLLKFYEEYSDIMERYKNKEYNSEERDRLLSEWRQKVTGELQKTREKAQAIKDAMGYDDIIKEEQFRSDLKSIADNWKSMLTGMETDAEEWGRNVARMMFEDLVERNIMSRLEEDLEHWYRRYQQVMDDISLTDEERAAKLAALQEEYVEMQEDYANATKAIAESLGYDPNNLFAELESSFIDALTDMNADADTWGKNIKQTILKRLIDAFVMDTALKGRLEELKEQLSEIFSDESLKAMTWEEAVRMATEAVKGMEQDFEKANELVKSFYDSLGLNESPFSNLKEDFKNALTDINATAEDFGRKIRESLLKELMQKNVFEVPITVNIEGEEQVFENFDAYSKNWNERYMQAIADNDRQTIDMLMDELMTVYGMTEERAKEYVEQLKKLTKDTTFTGLESSFVSSLMNMEEDAYDFGQQIGKTLAQRIVEQTIATQFIQPLLKKLQDAVDAALNEEGATYSSVIDNGLVKDAIDDITQAYPELQEAVKKIYEMLGISSSDVFGDLRGSLLSVLADMESDAESFGKAIGAKLAEQMLDEYVKATYQADIDSLQKELNEAIGAGDTEKIDAIRKKVEELIAAMGNDENVRKLTEELRRLSDTTFSGMTDSLTSALMDMNTSAKEWGRNIGRTLAEKIIRELIVSRQLQPYLNRIEDAYGKAVSAEGATIESIFAAVTPLIDETIAGMEELSPYIDKVLGKLGLLSTPFDNMRSSFLSKLMDMENDTEDFAADINRILTEAFIDRFVLGDEFDKRLSEWQEQYAAIMKGNYSEEERALLLKNLQAAITAAKEGYAEEAQAIHDLMGTGNAKDQTATMNMADKATYDQFETYLGIAVAQQMATLQGNEVRLQILATLQAMTGITSPNGDTVKEIRSMLNTTNEYLLDIKRSNRSILNLCGEKLDTIITRLQGLI